MVEAANDDDKNNDKIYTNSMKQKNSTVKEEGSSEEPLIITDSYKADVASSIHKNIAEKLDRE